MEVNWAKELGIDLTRLKSERFYRRRKQNWKIEAEGDRYWIQRSLIEDKTTLRGYANIQAAVNQDKIDIDDVGNMRSMRL